MDDANGILKLSWEPTDNAIAKKKTRNNGKTINSQHNTT